MPDSLIEKLESDRMRKEEIERYLKKNKGKIVKNSDTGQYGKIDGKSILVVNVDSPEMKLLYETNYEKKGITINDLEWKEFPKNNYN